MSRKLEGARLVVATHNPGKLAEINDLLGRYGVVAVPAASLGISEPDETETSFAGNARLKALHSSRASGLPAIADDSGLCVDALGGEPGVHSARWAGPSRDFAMAMRNIEEKLQARGGAKRNAHFVSALCIAWPDGQADMFEGRVDGALVWPPRGTRGFGYDPVFMPEGFDMTFGEMEPAQKHAMSHRARAFRKLADAIF